MGKKITPASSRPIPKSGLRPKDFARSIIMMAPEAQDLVASHKAYLKSLGLLVE